MLPRPESITQSEDLLFGECSRVRCYEFSGLAPVLIVDAQDASSC
jgi:hypothetical protein